jgi:hypothetical protein
MAVKQVSLGGMLSAIDENQPIATLLLDTSGNSETFFKYKGCLHLVYDPYENTPERLREKVKHSLTRGDTLVLSCGAGSDILNLFNPNVFPEECLNKSEITLEFLDRFKDSPNEHPPYGVDTFKMVVIVEAQEVPAWAQNLIARGRLIPVRIA